MDTATPTAANTEVREHRTQVWKEILIMGAFYGIYTLTRNRFGSFKVGDNDIPMHAFNNAVKVIRLERAMGLYHEETIQQWFLQYEWFLQALNSFYGTAHFAVTVTVFFVLFRRRKDVFPLYRNALAAMTGLAIVGFALFPLMPPRLLDEPCPPNGYGGACIQHELRNYNGATEFGFVDTLDEFGGPWNFSDGAMAKASNQYAAMPSLHIGWSSWVALGILPLARRRWVKIAVVLYPALTLFTIVVTGNHFWIDGVGGVAVLGLGFWMGRKIHIWNQQRLDAKFEQLRIGHPSAGAS